MGLMDWYKFTLTFDFSHIYYSIAVYILSITISKRKARRWNLEPPKGLLGSHWFYILDFFINGED